MTFNKKENLEPPLGICYIASMLRKMPEVNVALKDYEVEHFSREKFSSMLREKKIDVLGVSFRTASYGSAKECIKASRDAGRDIFTVAGGHHATAFPEETLRDLGCDAVIMGEGEYTFPDLVDRLERGEGLDGLTGVAFRGRDGGVTVNAPRPPIEDIDALPWPARDLLDMSRYNVVTLLTSRGCPFNCIYCDKAISTRKVKFRSPDDIYNEIRHIIESSGKNRLYIVDDHFFLKKHILEPILDRIIAEKLSIRWTCQARVDGVFSDTIVKAKQAGCEQIMFGIETGDPDELKYIRKASTL